MFKIEISLKRVQTFIFDVPRLKAMLGANALIGQVMRHELPKLLGNQGAKLDWSASIKPVAINDPLDAAKDPSDRDDPATLYGKGILARDGGHFIAVFGEEPAAEEFRRRAEEKLAELLPGVLFDAEIKPFSEGSKDERPSTKREPRETHLLDLPVLQVCQETGREPASDEGEKVDWQASSVTLRLKSGDDFYNGKTKDIVGLMRPKLYPDKMGWKEPDDLAQLAAGGYIALIHADGNGIGQRYKKTWRDSVKCKDEIDKADAEIVKEAHGEAFFHSMRVAVRRALVDALAETFIDAGGKRPYEVLMLGGDDLLLTCRADKALKLAEHYALELKKYKLADGSPLDVAIGVAIAQKTYPLHRLYELAESLASSAKRLYRSLKNGEKCSVIDWQVVTQSWFEGVAEARRKSDLIEYTVNGETETLLLTGRPYRATGDAGLEGLLHASEGLDSEDDKAARSPLRALRTACERGRLSGEMAFARLREADQATLAWKGEKHELWAKAKGVGKDFYLTRALDIIGIREINRLGRKKND